MSFEVVGRPAVCDSPRACAVGSIVSLHWYKEQKNYQKKFRPKKKKIATTQILLFQPRCFAGTRPNACDHGYEKPMAKGVRADVIALAGGAEGRPAAVGARYYCFWCLVASEREQGHHRRPVVVSEAASPEVQPWHHFFVAQTADGCLGHKARAGAAGSIVLLFFCVLVKKICFRFRPPFWARTGRALPPGLPPGLPA